MKNWILASVLLLSSLPAFGNSVRFTDSLTMNVTADNMRLTSGVDQLLVLSRFGATSNLELVVGPNMPGPYTMSMAWTLLLPNQAPQVLDFFWQLLPRR